MKHNKPSLGRKLITALSLFLVFNLLSVTLAFSQPPPLPIKWSYSTNKISDCEYELIFKGELDPGYHLYSQYAGKKLPGNDGDDGPLPTAFNFKKSKDYALEGKTIEPKGESDKSWLDLKVDVMSFHGAPVFKQKIKLLTDGDVTIKGTIDGMVCKEGACVPFFPQPAFEFKLKGTAACKDGNSTGSTTPENGSNPGSTIGCDCDSIMRMLTRMSGGVMPGTTNTTVNTPSADTTHKSGASASSGATPPATPGTYHEEVKETSPWLSFGGGFAGGLIALIMPCVFPMIPMTVSFFTKRSKTRAQGIRNAIIYALSIIVIYVSLGLLVTLTVHSAQAVNQLSSNIILNLSFFTIFILFGISFLGAFGIALPSRFVNKVDKASDRGGVIGIFFMAFTLALVTFSCTGPIIGTALVEALKGGVTGPLFVMLGFSVALALPFALFAMFPGWLNSLPKSGGWLNGVKVVMGLVEFALAMKFISNVDLSYHWGIVTRELFIAVWIVCFALVGFYLLGKLKFSHDSDVPHVSTPRAVLAILTFTFVIYLIPGMWGAPVRVLSGILPPSYYSENAPGFIQKAKAETKDSTSTVPDGVDPSHCPLNLNCFHNYDLALAYAKKVNKPLFIDFTGYNCANCRRMEDNVWPEPSVLNQLNNDYVVVSLYCDDKDELPDSLKYETKEGYSIETWGNKWSQMQIDRYGSNAQPLYVLLDTNEQLLCDKPSPYDPDAAHYANFLSEGVKRFKAKK